jgi:hypothetical protein
MRRGSQSRSRAGRILPEPGPKPYYTDSALGALEAESFGQTDYDCGASALPWRARFPATLPAMSFTVSFTGQGEDEGIVVDSLAQAVARVQQLQPEEFPAAIWQIPTGEDVVSGRLIRKFPAPPSGGAIGGGAV